MLNLYGDKVLYIGRFYNKPHGKLMVDNIVGEDVNKVKESLKEMYSGYMNVQYAKHPLQNIRKPLVTISAERCQTNGIYTTVGMAQLNDTTMNFVPVTYITGLYSSSEDEYIELFDYNGYSQKHPNRYEVRVSIDGDQFNRVPTNPENYFYSTDSDPLEDAGNLYGLLSKEFKDSATVVIVTTEYEWDDEKNQYKDEGIKKVLVHGSDGFALVHLDEYNKAYGEFSNKVHDEIDANYPSMTDVFRSKGYEPLDN